MSRAQVREKNPNWKGGRIVDPRGYVLVLVGKDHPLADIRGYAYEHRLSAQNAIGRDLRRGEQVHHDDEDKGNNAASNLIVTKSRAEHAALHRKRTDLRNPGQRNPRISCACGCGSKFMKFDSEGRPRRYVTGHNKKDDGRWGK